MRGQAKLCCIPRQTAPLFVPVYARQSVFKDLCVQASRSARQRNCRNQLVGAADTCLLSQQATVRRRINGADTARLQIDPHQAKFDAAL